MQHRRIERSWRIGIVAALVMLALAWWATASAQPEPPLRLYGSGAAGGTIYVSDKETGEELGTTIVPMSGEWHLDINCHADRTDLLAFAFNKAPVEVKLTRTGADQAHVAFIEEPMPTEGADDPNQDEMGADDQTLKEDVVGEGDELMEDDELTEDDGLAEDDGVRSVQADLADGDETAERSFQTRYPDSGTGGLLDQSRGPSATQTALLIAAAAAALALGIAIRHRRA